MRAYVYNPVRGASNITALVVWDGLTHLEAGGIVTSYTINLFKSGVLEVYSYVYVCMYSVSLP